MGAFSSTQFAINSGDRLSQARRDTYPSGMARDMGGGMKVYVLCPGQRTRPDLVETFDDAPSDQIATVEEQRAFADAWREERKQR